MASQGPAVKAARNNGKAKRNSNYPFYNTYVSDDELFEEMKKLYPELEGEDLAEKFRAYLKALNVLNDYKFIPKDQNYLYALFASFRPVQKSSPDPDNYESIFETVNRTKIHVSIGRVAFEPVYEPKGKGNALVPRKFTKADAENMALAAIHDSSMLFPNEIRITNASWQEKKLIKEALREVEQFLPDGKKFKFASGFSFSRDRQGLGGAMYDANARKEAERKKQETEIAEEIRQESLKRAVQNRRSTIEKVYEEHVNTLPEEFRTAYKGLSPEEQRYAAAKIILLEEPKKYEGKSFSYLTKDLQELFPDITQQEISGIRKNLEKEKLITAETTNNVTTITSIKDKGNKAELKDEAYNKLVAKIIHDERSWIGKQRKDIAQTVLGKPYDQIGKGSEDLKTLTRIWNQLKDSGIVSIEKGKIQSVVGYAGTKIGWEFARATKADASPFQAPPAMNPGYAAMDLAA